MEKNKCICGAGYRFEHEGITLWKCGTFKDEDGIHRQKVCYEAEIARLSKQVEQTAKECGLQKTDNERLRELLGEARDLIIDTLSSIHYSYDDTCGVCHHTLSVESIQHNDWCPIPKLEEYLTKLTAALGEKP